MQRRKYLRLLSAGAIGALAGCQSTLGESDDTTTDRQGPGRTTPEPATERDAEEERVENLEDKFDTVVDVVEDLDCDPSGVQPCNDAIADAAEDGTLFRFPEGTYQFSGYTALREYERIGVVGDGDVTFRPPQGFNDKLLDIEAGWAVCKDFDIDIRAENTTAGLRVVTDEGFHVENIEYVGRGVHRGDSVVDGLFPAVRNPDGVGVVKNLVAKQGSAWGHYGDGRAGIYVGSMNRGTVKVVDSRLEEFGGPGIYATATPGNVQVIGGTFRNNNVASIRIGGDGSFVDGAFVEASLEKYGGPRTREDQAFRLRGIIINQKSAYVDKPPGAEIRNAEVRIRDVPSPGGGVAVFGPAKTATIRDSVIANDNDGAPAVYRESRQAFDHHPASESERWLYMENVTVEGSASGGTAVVVKDAPESIVRDCDVKTYGENRNGIRFVTSPTSMIDGGTVRTTGYPVSIESGSPQSDRDILLYLRDGPSLKSTGVSESDEELLVNHVLTGPVDFRVISAFNTTTERVRISITAVGSEGVYGKVVSSGE